LIYEYTCIQCGNTFELIQSATAALQADCPACGSTAERQLPVNVSVHYKGNGFYATDYKKKDRETPKA
jgi:putative FmdB family regulatory protein